MNISRKFLGVASTKAAAANRWRGATSTSVHVRLTNSSGTDRRTSIAVDRGSPNYTDHAVALTQSPHLNRPEPQLLQRNRATIRITQKRFRPPDIVVGSLRFYRDSIFFHLFTSTTLRARWTQLNQNRPHARSRK